MQSRAVRGRFMAALCVMSICLSWFGSGAHLEAMPIGFASVNGGTTGGGNGATVTATTSAQFQNFATQSGALNINVVGSLNVGSVQIASDKTILGVGSTGELIGSLRLTEVDNVIIQNLSISNPADAGEGDSITLRESTNVWIDHNNIFDAPDGLLDITRESDFVTVSWNKFYYTDTYANTVNTNHRFAMLIGNSDSRVEDADNLRVTMHHNHWGNRVRERMPRARYGDIHVFNDYFNSPGNNYAIRAAVGSELLVENNSFENIDEAYIKFSNSAGVGLIEASGNQFVNTTGNIDDGNDDVFTPPYSYTLDDAADVKDLVLAGAGVGMLSSATPGDFNHDGMVDAADYTVWLANLGAADSVLGGAGDGIGVVDSGDYDLWKTNFEQNNASASESPVPEPSALSLLLLAPCLLATFRARTQR